MYKKEKILFPKILNRVIEDIKLTNNGKLMIEHKKGTRYYRAALWGIEVGILKRATFLEHDDSVKIAI